jgi:hypothetical protein
LQIRYSVLVCRFNVCLLAYVFVYVYVCVCVERERERQTDRQTERVWKSVQRQGILTKGEGSLLFFL